MLNNFFNSQYIMGNAPQSPTGAPRKVSFSNSGYLLRVPSFTAKPQKRASHSLMVNEFIRPTATSFDRLTHSINSHHVSNAPKCKIVDFKVHVGIDIGCDGSALSFAYNNEVNPYTQWKTNSRLNIQKSKTYILSDAKNNIIAIGENAKQIYSSLSGSEKNEWKFFDHLKLSLEKRYSKRKQSNGYMLIGKYSMNISSELTAINGSKGNAQTLFARIFKQLKHIAMEYLHKNVAQDMDDTDIQWVITVPALWGIVARQTMRQWAIAAELVQPQIRNQCRIVSESDCAALAIKEIYHTHPMDTESKEDEDYHHNHHIHARDVSSLSIDPFNIVLTDDTSQWAHLKSTSCQDKYIVIHAEDGMVDITCHDVRTGQCMKEVHYRSMRVNEMFKLLLTNIFGEWMNAFINEYPNIYMEIMDHFESAKCNFWGNNQCQSPEVTLPYEFVQFLHAKCKETNQILNDKIHHFTNGKSLESLFFVSNGMINMTQSKVNPISLRDEMLILDINIWKYMFDYGINKIAAHVEQILPRETESLHRECKWMYLVGHLACSKYFVYRMKARFESKGILKVIVPDHPTWTVALGAAYFGIRKNAITARKCTASYGIRVCDTQGYGLFHTGYDSDKIGIQNDFHVMVHRNEWIQVNDTTQFIAKSDAKVSTLEILKSEQKLPQFQSHGEKLGSFQIQYDAGGEVIVEFHFGEATFVVYTYIKENPAQKRILKEIVY
eukprot:1069161_1